MSAILDLPEVRARVCRWPVDAYEQLGMLGVLGKNFELIRGVIVEKMPKSPLHRRLTKKIYDRFLAQMPEGCVVFSEAPLRLSDSEPEPDVMIVRGGERDYDEIHPTTAELVVEVAVSSVALDRENASLYAEAGAPEYWIVLGEERKMEVYRQPVNGVYQQKRVYTTAETLACESVPGLQATLEEWFA